MFAPPAPACRGAYMGRKDGRSPTIAFAMAHTPQGRLNFRPVQIKLKSASVQQPLLMERLPFPLSSRLPRRAVGAGDLAAAS